MPWGPQTQGLLIYRHMLPRSSFRGAIQNVGEPGAERSVMRSYYPRSRYLEQPEFEKRGCRRR